MFVVMQRSNSTEFGVKRNPFPCCSGLDRHQGWDKLLFKTYEEAKDYTDIWLGEWALGAYMIDQWYDYNEYGDFIGIFDITSLEELYNMMQGD
jgi:hypothetical protein